MMEQATRLQFVRICECGCGQPTLLITRSAFNRGLIKGRPMRYLLHHSGGKITRLAEERFWSKVDRRGPCWLWMAGISGPGYGKFTVLRRQVASHVYAYELTHGPVPKGMVVRHSCDNPACCNPAHLLLGTQQDNIDDMMARGRNRSNDRSGEDHNRALLTA